jgi:uncharacterized protein YraI
MRTSSCVRLMFGVCLLAVSAAAAAQNAYTSHPVSVFAGPDDSYPMVAQLDADTPVQVMGCLDDWSWCDVALGDNRGWLYAPDIVYDYEGGYVPFYTYAPSLGVPVVQFTLGDYWDRYYHGRPWYERREDWIDRGPPHHRRPQGPPPSAGPPPRSARMDKPSGEGQPQRPLRLGSTDRPRQDAEPRDARPPEPRDARPPEPRDARPPEPRDARSPREERPPSNTEPPRREERAVSPQPQRAPEAARHDEPRRAEKPSDRPNDTPH